jgi:5-formyltetrahydrofolate cyclo-ligase
MKDYLRKQGLRIRNTLTNEEITKKSHEILTALQGMEKELSHKQIFIFLDFRNEVSTAPIISYLKKIGSTVYIPRVDMTTKNMEIHRFISYDVLEVSPYGILEPNPQQSHPVDASLLEVIITPGLVFDKRGYRIGYGGGFYDRLFEKIGASVLKIGIAFDCQVIDEIQPDVFDIPVDRLITESNQYMF